MQLKKEIAPFSIDFWYIICLFIHYLTLFLFPNAHLQYNVYHDDAIKWRQTIARQRPNNDSIEHGVFSIKTLPHSYHTITLSLMTIAPSICRAIALSRHHIIVITLSDNRFIVIASSLRRHRILVSSHYRPKRLWCDDAMVNYKTQSEFHTSLLILMNVDLVSNLGTIF